MHQPTLKCFENSSARDEVESKQQSIKNLIERNVFQASCFSPKFKRTAEDSRLRFEQMRLLFIDCGFRASKFIGN